ncbi:DUF3168 domain-containing protein [Methylobacterium sp. HMF5984]|uniref:tail completion protein gp17 n=1 Tax=Methylobacterium sp. HMF5984 TaxID=3367370 RepID=UPI003853EABD
MTDASPGTALAPPAPSPLLALRAALIARFSTDAALARLMGGTFRLYDEPPAGAQPVYALFGDAEIRDDSVDGAVRCSFSEKFPVSRTSLYQFSNKFVCGLVDACWKAQIYRTVMLSGRSSYAVRFQIFGDRREFLP